MKTTLACYRHAGVAPATEAESIRALDAFMLFELASCVDVTQR